MHQVIYLFRYFIFYDIIRQEVVSISYYIKTIFLIITLYLTVKGFNYLRYFLSAARYKHRPLTKGNCEIPVKRSLKWNDCSALKNEIIEEWTSRALPPWQIVEGKKKAKVDAPRIILAKMALNKDIDDITKVNNYLLGQEPWGNCGSTWGLNKKGDYDFTLAVLTAILYLYGDKPDILFPETKDHLISTLLTKQGGSPLLTVPKTCGLIRDTENHILMTEGSRYLKNRWLYLHNNTDPLFNNKKNGLESWMLSFLEELKEAGLYEFNSIPYFGYTMTALLNLASFASEEVRKSATEIIDRLNWEYALGSLSLRRFAPFRRQLRKESIRKLDMDYHTIMMKVWLSLMGNSEVGKIGHLDLKLPDRGLHHALIAALMLYRPSDKTMKWVVSKPERYFVRIGHGTKASPEIYSGGPGHLISAGGVHRGKRSMIVARPITLMFNDGAKNLDEVIHLYGPGDDFRNWNNTGVYKDFACAAGPVHIPENWSPEIKNKTWSIYECPDNFLLAVHSRHDLGIICLFHKGNAKMVLEKITELNNDKALYHQFIWPEGDKIEYDTEAPENKWVIVAIDGDNVSREYDKWSLIEMG